MGHHLQPIVTIGKAGVTSGVIEALGQALLDHELVKIRIGKTSLEDRFELKEQILKPAGAEFVKMVGKTLIVYKAHPEKPTIKLPKK